jgi:uncharacterized protein YuzE
MKIEYDQTVDSVYFQMVDSSIYESEEIDPGIIYDYDKDDKVVGVEVLHIKGRVREETKNINFPFSEDQRAILREFFMNVLA